MPAEFQEPVRNQSQDFKTPVLGTLAGFSDPSAGPGEPWAWRGCGVQGLPHPQKGLALGLRDIPAECFCTPGATPGSLVDGRACGRVEGLQAQVSHVGSQPCFCDRRCHMSLWGELSPGRVALLGDTGSSCLVYPTCLFPSLILVSISLL